MRDKKVELTLIDGSIWYVPSSEFSHFDVPEDPVAILSNYIRGSRGPLLQVYSEHTESGLSGEKRYINANFIASVKVTYNN